MGGSENAENDGADEPFTENEGNISQTSIATD